MPVSATLGQFARRFEIPDGTSRPRVIRHDRLSEAGRLGHSNITGNDRVDHQVAEVRPHVGGHLIGQPGPAVVHREQHGTDDQPGVQVGLDHLDAAEQLGQPLEGVVLALDRDEHLASPDQRVQRQQAERRRAVDEDVVEILGAVEQTGERPLQPVLTRHLRRQFEVGPGEVNRGRRTEQGVRDLDGRDHVRELPVAEEHVIHGRRADGVIDAECRARIALRIKIDDKHAQAMQRHCGRDVDCRRGLSDATLLVRDGDHAGVRRLGPTLPVNIHDMHRLHCLAGDRSVEHCFT